MALGAVMVWASASEDSGLGTFLTIFGWGILGISALLFVLFPGVYRAIANPFMPSDMSGFSCGASQGWEAPSPAC